MQAGKRLKMMKAQYSQWTKNPDPYYIPFMDDKDYNLWHVVICNLPAPFLGAEIIAKFYAGADFPQKAPKDLKFLTPNGVFAVGHTCISIGEHHDSGEGNDKNRTDVWRPVMGMTGFAQHLASALISYKDLGTGLGIINNPTAPSITKMSLGSKKYNIMYNSDIHNLLEQFIKDNPENPTVQLLLKSRATLIKNKVTDVQDSKQTENVKQVEYAKSKTVETVAEATAEVTVVKTIKTYDKQKSKTKDDTKQETVQPSSRPDNVQPEGLEDSVEDDTVIVTKTQSPKNPPASRPPRKKNTPLKKKAVKPKVVSEEDIEKSINDLLSE